jgi:hypothetical protein
MDFILWKTCDLCKGLFNKKNMVHNVMIGVHYPWSFCEKCHKKEKSNMGG